MATTQTDIQERIGTARPDGCTCVDGHADLPCWPCYRAGFETINPTAPAIEDV